jgi:hypothetical protein
MNVLGSFGFVCGTVVVLVPEPEPLPPLPDERLFPLLLLFDTLTPTPTPIAMTAMMPTTEPRIYAK